MASPGVLYNSTDIEEAEINAVIDYSVFATAVFLVYAYATTLGSEVNYIWTEPRRPISWLYGFIRYPGIVSQLIDATYNASASNCRSVAGLSNWTEIISTIGVYLFQILRTYAVCGNNVVLAIVLIIIIVPAVAMAFVEGLVELCSNSTGDFTMTEYNILLASDTLFESVIFAATVWATWSQARSANGNTMSMPGQALASSILRNGTLYYGVFLLVEIWVIVTSNLPETALVQNLGNPPAVFFFPIRFTLSCQFILELRARSEKMSRVSSTAFSSSHATSTMSAFHATVDFVRHAIEDDLGEPLVHATDHEINSAWTRHSEEAIDDHGNVMDIELQGWSRGDAKAPGDGGSCTKPA